MNKAVRFLIVASFIFSFTFTIAAAHADSENGEDSAKHRLEDLRLKRDEAKQRLQQKRDQIRLKRDELRDKTGERLEISKQKIAERIKKIFARILRRLNVAIERLDNIAERIASRIDKLQEKGVDTSAAEKELAEAEALGAAASEAVGNAAAAIEAVDTTDLTVREAIQQAKSAVTVAKDALKAYHKGLVEAIRQLKAANDLRTDVEGESDGE